MRLECTAGSRTLVSIFVIEEITELHLLEDKFHNRSCCQSKLASFSPRSIFPLLRKETTQDEMRKEAHSDKLTLQTSDWLK